MDIIKNILVPVDGSEHAHKAIDFAVDMAMQNDATIHLLHVVESTKIPKGVNDYIRSASYVPKEEMVNITTFLNDILEANEKGENFWWRWLKRFGSYFDKVFGPDWQESDKEYWEKYRLYY